jgi:hypothetical protein
LRPEKAGRLRQDRVAKPQETKVDEDVPSRDARSAYRLVPGLRLIAALRLAFNPWKLVLAALGLLLLQLGWSVLDLALPASAAVTPEAFDLAQPAAARADRDSWPRDGVAALTFRLVQPVRFLTTPLAALLDPASGWGTMGHALLGLIWLMIVWGICGGAIARIAVVQFAATRQCGIVESLRFALPSAGPLIGAPLCPLLAMAVCALTGVAFGLLYRLPGVGPALAGAGLVIPLVVGLVMTLLVAGVVAGWPLLHAAMAAGADDALDALSRTFSYLNQRLGLFFVGLAWAWLGGIVGLFVVDLLVDGVIDLTRWSLSLSAPGTLTAELFSEGGARAGPIAAATHRFWLRAVRLLASGWIFSYFWTAAAGLYLWLRHEVDGTPWTEVDLPAVIPGARPDRA